MENNTSKKNFSIKLYTLVYDFTRFFGGHLLIFFWLAIVQNMDPSTNNSNNFIINNSSRPNTTSTAGDVYIIPGLFTFSEFVYIYILRCLYYSRLQYNQNKSSSPNPSVALCATPFQYNNKCKCTSSSPNSAGTPTALLLYREAASAILTLK